MTASRQQLASLLDRLAETFDHSAELADEHAARLSYPTTGRARDIEHDRAQHARDAAARARTYARRMRQDASPQ